MKRIKTVIAIVCCLILCGCESITSFTPKTPTGPDKITLETPSEFTLKEAEDKKESVEEPKQAGPVVADAMITASERYAEAKYEEEQAAKQKSTKYGDYTEQPLTKEQEVGNGAPYGYPKGYLNDGSPFSMRMHYYVCGSCNGLFSTYQERNYHEENTCPVVIQQREEYEAYRKAMDDARVWKCPFCGLDCGSINTGGGESVFNAHLNANHMGQVDYYYWGLGGHYGYYRRVWTEHGWDETEITKEEYDNR